jgi:glycosyltransferase involved in cell wall biosynthesis
MIKNELSSPEKKAVERPTIVLFFKGTNLGGAELNVLRILTHLRQVGCRTLLVTSSKDEIFDRFVSATDDQLVTGFPYPSKPSSWVHIPRFFIEVRRFLNRNKGKHILLSGDFYTLWGALMFKSKSRHVFSLWQGEYRFHDDSCVRKWLRYGAAQADRLLSSQPVAAHANGLGMLQKVVMTLNPCVNEQRFNPALYNRDQLRQNYGWDTASHIAVCIGRIGEEKGQRWLAQQFLSDLRFPKSARLIIVGPGSSACLEPLQKIELSSEGRIQVWGSRSDIPELLAAADLAIQPGTFVESFGMSALEAALMRLPLLAFVGEALSFTLGCDYPGLVSLQKRHELMDRWLSLATQSNVTWACASRDVLLSKFSEKIWSEQLLNAMSIS